MKPFLLNIIQCEECNKDNLSLRVDRVVKLEDDDDIDYAKIKSRVSHNQNFIRAFDEINIEGEYYSRIKNDKDDDILFNNDIIEGLVECEDCKRKFKIYDGIVDLL